jgi:ATP-dependent Clp protease ATP-binding subunit ClpC
MTNKFSNQYRLVLLQAQKFANESNEPAIKPTHILDALIQTKGSIAFELIHKLGFVTTKAQDFSLPIENTESINLLAEIKLSVAAKKIIRQSVLVAAKYNHLYISTEHLLQGIINENQQLIKAFLANKNYNFKDLHNQLKAVMKNTSKFQDLTASFSKVDEPVDKPVSSKTKRRPRQKTKTKESLLDFFALELTSPKQQERIKPVIGRAGEIDRIIQILARLDKNNPVLLGEPGVGKTAIIEGLARKIIEGQVPDILLNKKIFSLDLSLLVAGSMYRGEFESRLKQLLDEIREDENIIVFVDEIHNIVGAGAAGGAMDAANILKPALARGEIRMIGATTFAEYKKYIEPDTALERRLQAVVVTEPSVTETIQILKGIRDAYEQHHGVRIVNEAIHAAAELSHRYLTEKFLPDKAIDLIDEAAAKVKVGLGPRKENKAIKDLEQQLDLLAQEKTTAVEMEDFPKALAIKEKEREQEALLDNLLDANQPATTKLQGKIGATEVAELISQITNIPAGDLVASEMKQLRDLASQLQKKIIGQAEAIDYLSQAIKRAKTGLGHIDKPLGSFIFLGPSGVGKTETAKVLAEEVFGSSKALIRFDMSEFAEGFNISRLIGSPAGYVGYREGGQLTEKVRRRPYSVILFDEIEKAHPEIFNILLQILDDGFLTDATGKKVDFRNTIIILTSNVGLREFSKGAQIGFAAGDNAAKKQAAEKEYSEIKSAVKASLKKKFRPEFLNRLDKIIVYKPLQPADIKKITVLEMSKLIKQAKDKRVNIKVDTKLIKLISEKSFTPQEGARAIRKNLQDLVMSPLADKLLAKELVPGSQINISAEKDKVVFN